MNSMRGFSVLILVGLLLVLNGCKQPHPGWEPPLEETSTRFLQDEVGEALELIRNARVDVHVDPAQAEGQLVKASRALERVSIFYLPLLEAREHAYDAHRLVYFNQKNRARTHIEAVESILDTMAEKGGPRILPALEEPLGLASEAKAAIMAKSDRAPDHIKSLARKLNYMAWRGELEIPSDWPEAESSGP